MRQLQRLARLGRESGSFMLAVVVMSGVRLALLRYSPRHIARRLDALNRKYPRADEGMVFSLPHLARRIAQASRFSPVPTTCLSEALVAKALLARHGHSGELIIGVQKTGAGFRAHAWVECPGDVIIGNAAPEGVEFKPLSGTERLIR